VGLSSPAWRCRQRRCRSALVGSGIDRITESSDRVLGIGRQLQQVLHVELLQRCGMTARGAEIVGCHGRAVGGLGDVLGDGRHGGGTVG
jgi:hypothetical protein